jgi:hypothetical protein
MRYLGWSWNLRALPVLLSLSGLLGLVCQNEDFQRRESVSPYVPKDEPSQPETEQPSPPTTDTDDPPIFQDCEQNRNRPFVADLYRLPEETYQLLDFSLLTPSNKSALAS